MRAHQFITETPLPSSWDSSQFDTNTKLCGSMAAYARKRARALGEGSSRVVLEIPYKGKATALKVAMNMKGLAQNKEEAIMMNSPFVKSSGKVIPLIDYDKENGSPTWIHVAVARPFTRHDEKKWFGDLYNFQRISYNYDNPEYVNQLVDPQQPEIVKNLREYMVLIRELDERFNLRLIDITMRNNWGMYKGKPVILDLGFTDSVAWMY